MSLGLHRVCLREQSGKEVEKQVRLVLAAACQTTLGFFKRGRELTNVLKVKEAVEIHSSSVLTGTCS